MLWWAFLTENLLSFYLLTKNWSNFKSFSDTKSINIVFWWAYVFWLKIDQIQLQELFLAENWSKLCFEQVWIKPDTLLSILNPYGSKWVFFQKLYQILSNTHTFHINVVIHTKNNHNNNKSWNIFLFHLFFHHSLILSSYIH